MAKKKTKKKTGGVANTHKKRIKVATLPVDYSKPLKNAKHERFCQEMMIDNNQARSYGITYPDSSTKSAEQAGSKLSRNLKVKGRLNYLKDKLAKKYNVTQERIIAEYCKIGFANIQDVLTDDNTIVDISQIERDKAAAVESIQSDIRHDNGDSDGYTEKVKLKFHSKTSALDSLGKHLGIFEKDNAQKKDNLADFLKAFKDE